MNIFMTGATGYVGRHVLEELAEHGHTVTALSRRKTNPVLDGVTWVEGDLAGLQTHQQALISADAIIHCAMEYQNGKEAGDQDLAALDVMRESGTYIVMTGNLYTTAPNKTGIIDEHLMSQPENWRNEAEQRVVSATHGGASIRLGFVYGGTGGYFWDVFAPCSDGLVFYTGDGSSTWPMVHIHDVARLYRLVVEQKAMGIFHAADDTPLSVRHMVEIASRHHQGRPCEIPFGEAKEKLGGFADHMLRTISPALGNGAAIGWSPRYPSFNEAADQAYVDYCRYRQEHAAE